MVTWHTMLLARPATTMSAPTTATHDGVHSPWKRLTKSHPQMAIPATKMEKAGMANANRSFRMWFCTSNSQPC
jgi:hypothetical protein